MKSRYQGYLKTIKRLSGASHREAQLTWMRLGPWLNRHDSVSSAAIGRHPKKLAEYVALAQGFVPPGWEVEISLRTTGGTYRRDGRRVIDRRPLYVKIVSRSREAMTVAEHERSVRLAIRAGAVQTGFQFSYADWEKGTGRHMNSGTITNAVDLRNFYGALKHRNTEIRADMVAPEGEEGI